MSDTQPTVSSVRARTEKRPILKPKFHHTTLKTTRLQEMIDFYTVLVGVEVIFQYPLGAWLSNDEANHRIALLAFSGLTDDAEKEMHTGLHHSAFEYSSIDELLETYLRLKEAGIMPDMCLDHGMTTSFYYQDPDGNRIELQVDNFGDWSQSREFMRSASAFHEDPLGQPVDPDQLVAASEQGLTLDEIHERAYTGQYKPAVLPFLPRPD